LSCALAIFVHILAQQVKPRPHHSARAGPKGLLRDVIARRGTQRQGWHRQDIRAELVKRYGAITNLSQAWGYGRTAISNALRGTSSWPAIEQRIAEALGTTPQAIWPDRWTPQGVRRPREIIKANASRTPEAPHRQKREAA
jgi:Ner family transcriptional regulator